MEFFTFLGLGMGLGFAFLLHQLGTPAGPGSGSAVTHRSEKKSRSESRSSAALPHETKGAAEDSGSTIHRSTQLLTDEESEEAAEALRTALGKRR